MSNLSFKSFLLNENRAYLGQKVGDILTAAHELRDDAKNMGTRDLTRFSERIVNQIRRILHSHWPREEHKNLEALQKVGVAIMKAIEEKDDLPGVISGACSELEKVSSKLGVPINKFAKPDKAEPSESPKGISGPVKDVAGAVPNNAPPPNNSTPPAPETAPPLAGNGGQLTAF